MAKDLAELLALKQEKMVSIAEKRERIKELNTYFENHKYSILWSYLNPLKESSKNKINSYIQIAEALIPQELSGIKLMETELGKTSAQGLGLLLGRTLLNLLLKRRDKKKEKRKHKKKTQKEIITDI
jgi:hypothetical protein